MDIVQETAQPRIEHQGSADVQPRRSVVVVPAYRAAKTVLTVVERALRVADLVIVVDDACPERSGDLVEPAFASDRVIVIRHEKNGGVGAAMKTGIRRALELGAEVIVKLDADDQMDVSYVPHMIELLSRYPELDLVKGNRFADPQTLHQMPAVRLFGNAGLTLLVKASSGYWTLVDPTNGFLAFRAEAIGQIALDTLADRYFFEIDVLCALGLSRRAIAELEMPSIYKDERSSLSIRRVLWEFPPLLLWRFLRRIALNYFIVEFNVATVCAVIGLPLLLVGVVFGLHEWALSLAEGTPRTPGTVILALLLFIVGFQLSLQALFYDVQFSTRTVKVRRSLRPSREEKSDLFFR